MADAFIYYLINTIKFYIHVNLNIKGKNWEHRTKFYPKSFTAKYNCNKIICYQTYPRIEEAIEREKQIKGGSRKVKEELIKSINPTWKDLCEDIQPEDL